MSRMIKMSLGKIGQVKMCKRVLKEQTSENEKIPFYKISTFGEEANTFISNELFLEFKEKYSYPNKGDILISAAGTVGKTVIFDGKPSYFQDSNIVWIENNEKIILNRFLYYFYQTKPWQTTNGSTITRIYNEDLRSIKLTFPESLSTQQKIASVLSALDDKIELNNRINAELEAMAKTLYDYWFVQFDFPIVTSSGVEKPYKSSGGKMVYNETLKREIPEGWEVKTIGDYCKSTGGFAFKSSWWTDNGMPVVKIKDIQEDYTINLSDLAFVDISDKNIDDKFKAKPGDVLIAMTGATVGKYAIVPYTEKPLYVNQRVGYFNLGIKPEKKLPFLINSLNQKYFRESVFTLASGAAQPNISNEQINNIQLLLPSKEIIELYNKVFEPYYSKILLNQKQNQELSALRDWLLPMLMNGQVKVG